MTKAKASRQYPESWRALLAHLMNKKKRFRRLLGLIVLVAVLVAGLVALGLYLSSGNPGHDLGMLFMAWEQRRMLR
jgi:hypothetical protein